ncbi:MAG: hypothetical protein HY898_00520 [Deltaproteobacteria bacterium]|nr:hypothetical protein [Deltaproteobacteria bacterium]
MSRMHSLFALLSVSAVLFLAGPLSCEGDSESTTPGPGVDAGADGHVDATQDQAADTTVETAKDSPAESAPCPAGDTLCGVECVDLETDPSNCGGCGVACQASDVCGNGSCATWCPSGTSNCAGKCVATEVDPSNCGGCGKTCKPGELCSSGACALTCQQGLTDCNGTCVNLSTDNANCGQCGQACPTGEVCSAKSCALTCQQGLTDCGGTCVNLSTDNANCGQCGQACPAGELCSAKTCALTCQQGLTDCSGTCVNLSTDNANCGQCGQACPTGELCSNKACDVACQQGLTECSGLCANLGSDNLNCGQCGHACVGNTACSQGYCVVACPLGTTDCSGHCADLTADPQNCGSCGFVCPTFSHATSTCSSSGCHAACNAGWADCKVNINGCETNLENDPQNCGACGNVCPSGFCSSSKCDLIVFVSDDAFTGNLGGIAGANAICVNLANNAGLSGTFRAWLGDDTHIATGPTSSPHGAYRLVDGTVVVADATNLNSPGDLLHAINRTQWNQPVPATPGQCCDHAVFTGVVAAEHMSTGKNCDNWTNGASGEARMGSAIATIGNTWTSTCWSSNPSGCAAPAHIYCFQK